jgi:hypothetical protein
MRPKGGPARNQREKNSATHCRTAFLAAANYHKAYGLATREFFYCAIK